MPARPRGMPPTPAQQHHAIEKLGIGLRRVVRVDQRRGLEPGRAGRDRTTEAARWRPRLIDLDLIAVEDLVLDREDLRLPHPEMHKREFVLAPFCEVWPDWRHPVLDRSAAELLRELRAAQP